MNALKVVRLFMAKEDELSGSEALYGFCGWLTTRDEPTVMSGHDECGGIADLVDTFCKTNDLSDPRDGWDKMLKHPRTAAYPDHPDSVVIIKGDRITAGPNIYEIDVWNYYDGIKGEMLKELKGREIFLGMKLEGQTGKKPLFIRHPWDKKGAEYIDINTEADFEKYMSGRTVEFHLTMPRVSPYYIVDFDASGEWGDTKKIIGEIADGLGKLPEVKKVEIRYSGKRGFHVLGWLKKPTPIDKAREDLKTWLKETFGDRDDVVVGESPKGDKGALGVSPMKFHGGQVALWSLRTTGLCCVEIPRSGLMSFKKEDASMEKVYKRLTGKTFVFSDKKKTAGKVVKAFLEKIDARQEFMLEKILHPSQIQRLYKRKDKPAPGKPGEPFAEPGEKVIDLTTGKEITWPPHQKLADAEKTALVPGTWEQSVVPRSHAPMFMHREHPESGPRSEFGHGDWVEVFHNGEWIKRLWGPDLKNEKVRPVK